MRTANSPTGFRCSLRISNLAHDYPESQAQTATTLNELSRRLSDFIALYTTARDAIRPRLRNPTQTT